MYVPWAVLVMLCSLDPIGGLPPCMELGPRMDCVMVGDVGIIVVKEAVAARGRWGVVCTRSEAMMMEVVKRGSSSSGPAEGMTK